MKIKNIIFLLITSMLFLSINPLDRIQKKIDKEIKSTFKIDSYSLMLISIEDSVSKSLPVLFNDNFKKIYNNKILVGYSYNSKAPSLYNLYDYLIIQFIGKSWLDSFLYSKEISAISGATISVKSMIKAVEDFMISIKILDEKNIIK